MAEFLIQLQDEKEEEYRLLLAYFHLLSRNLEGSLKEMDILEKNKLQNTEERKGNERTFSFSPFIKVIHNDNWNFQEIVTDSLYSHIARRLWDTGYYFLFEDKLDKCIAAFDRCVQLSNEFHEPISHQYFNLGNTFLRTGNSEKAILFIHKAIRLNPQNYFFHLILAEAYWQKGARNEAISEYRIGFNHPSLSEDLILQIASKPRLFAVWENNRTWHLLWRSDHNSRFTGNIYFDRKIGALQKYHLSKKDVLNQNKSYAAEFSVSTNRRAVKTLDINMGKRSVLTCYIKINDQEKTDDIIFVHSGENPQEIPFTLPSSEMK